MNAGESGADDRSFTAAYDAATVQETTSVTNPGVEQRYSVSALGPVTVTRADAPIDLGGPKQRLVLALLMSSPDHVVATSRLIDKLWGEEPPATARKALQMHVSNLRRALGEEFPLRTASGGYLVQSADLDYDVQGLRGVGDPGNGAVAHRPDRGVDAALASARHVAGICVRRPRRRSGDRTRRSPGSTSFG